MSVATLARGLVAAAAFVACTIPTDVLARSAELDLITGVHALDTDDLVQTDDPTDPRFVSMDGSAPLVGLRCGVRWQKLALHGCLLRSQRSRSGAWLSRSIGEAEVSWILLDHGRAQLRLRGGAGIAATRATDAQESEGRIRKVPCLSTGLGVRIEISPRLYLEPGATMRWYAEGHDEPDWSATLGVGFVLGHADTAKGVKEPAR
jgi:hypothetical protein